MALLKVLQYPHPTLLKTAAVVEDYTIYSQLITDMCDTMHNGEQKGIGLAAPQVGYSIQLFVLGFELLDNEWQLGGCTAFINVNFTQLSQKKCSFPGERCLSCPQSYQVDKHRSCDFVAEYFDSFGNKHMVNTSTISHNIVHKVYPIAFQHEHDHLMGDVICDLANVGDEL